MKNLILLLVCFLIAITVTRAQAGFGLKAGINLSKISGDWEEVFDDFEDAGIDMSPKFKTGLNIGFFLETRISENFVFQPEVLFSMKGVKFKDDFKEFEETSSYIYNSEGDFILTQELNYIEIPVFIKYKFLNGVTLGAGPYLGILVSAKAKMEINYEATFFDKLSGLTTSEEGSEENSSSSTSGLSTIDAGLHAGLGYEFPFGLGIDARFVKGFSNVFDQDTGNDKFTNTAFQFSLRYKITGTD